VLLGVDEPAPSGGASRFWAVGRSPTGTGNRGFELVHAATPAGPWTSGFEVNFFGGFAREPSGTIWMGDEGGGVYRSVDGAVTFTDVSPSTAVACLTYAHGALWGCRPGTPEQPALGRWNDARGAFDDVVTLADITRLVQCDPPTEVETLCAAAWVEWQRDVLMIPPPKPALADAGAARTTESDSSCSLAPWAARRSSSSDTVCFALAALLLRARRRRFH
jgi:hypothetical protein